MSMTWNQKLIFCCYLHMVAAGELCTLAIHAISYHSEGLNEDKMVPLQEQYV